MYLLFVVQEESSYARKFSSFDEAMSFFKNAIDDTQYNIAVALYDLAEESYFGLTDYGFNGNPIKSWHNEDY